MASNKIAQSNLGTGRALVSDPLIAACTIVQLHLPGGANVHAYLVIRFLLPTPLTIPNDSSIGLAVFVRPMLHSPYTLHRAALLNARNKRSVKATFNKRLLKVIIIHQEQQSTHKRRKIIETHKLTQLSDTCKQIPMAPNQHVITTVQTDPNLASPKTRAKIFLLIAFCFFYATMSVSVCPSDCDGSALWSRCMPGRGEGSSRAMLATAGTC